MSPLVKQMVFERRRQRVSATELARRAGLSRSGLVRVEAGGRTPTIENFAAAVEALGGRVTIEWPSK